MRFDRLTPESQTTLDTILEEKIRLQQSGVAPGSVAKAGAGMAVRRPSGAFATIDGPAARPGRRRRSPSRSSATRRTRRTPPHGAPHGAAPVSPMPASSTRSGPLGSAAPGNSIFNRPRTTSGLRTVPIPSALFEPPTTEDIDKALSALEEKGPAPALPIAPLVIDRTDSKCGSVTTSRRRCSTAGVGGRGRPPTARSPARFGRAGVRHPNRHGERRGRSETQRRSVDPNSGRVTLEGAATARRPTARATRRHPRSSMRRSRRSSIRAPRRPRSRPPRRSSKPSATGGSSSSAVPKKITMDRPAATESGHFRSDTRYGRKARQGAAGGARGAGHRRRRGRGGLLREGSARRSAPRRRSRRPPPRRRSRPDR